MATYDDVVPVFFGYHLDFQAEHKPEASTAQGLCKGKKRSAPGAGAGGVRLRAGSAAGPVLLAEA
ncbi:MAG TPA: hypothetical protein RMG48_00195, partial [Myxococcales bacterium LLY-WYZ-16_1]|nr:hypothetical protein [Myxococcales bacterium LLY-WYZ-16_1]